MPSVEKVVSKFRRAHVRMFVFSYFSQKIFLTFRLAENFYINTVRFMSKYFVIETQHI